jgi:hypothetical protein
MFLKTIKRILGVKPVRHLTPADFGVRYAKPVNGFAEILPNNPDDPIEVELVKRVNEQCRAVSEFNLRYAQAYDYPRFLKICAARKIDPESVGPTIPNMPTDFRNWLVAA